MSGKLAKSGAIRRILLLTSAIFVALVQVADAQTRLLMIVVDFPTSTPTDAQYLQWMTNDAAEVDAFTTNENSYGLAPQVTDVVGPFVIDSTGLIGGGIPVTGTIADRAQAAASANGVDVTPYQFNAGNTCGHFVYLFPDRVGIAGYGNGCGVWIGGAFNRTWPPGFHTLAHEEGHHIFGLTHAHAYECSLGAIGLDCPRNSTPQFYEYGDIYDLMGQGGGQFNNAMKAALGWLTITQMDHDGDYLLEPLENTTGVRALAFPMGKKGMFRLILEYRQPIGHDAYQPWANPSNVFNGVIVRWPSQNAWSPGGYDTDLIRMSPDTPNQYGTVYKFNNAALPVGQIYCDAATHKGITVVNTSPAGAVVRLGRCR